MDGGRIPATKNARGTAAFESQLGVAASSGFSSLKVASIVGGMSASRGSQEQKYVDVEKQLGRCLEGLLIDGRLGYDWGHTMRQDTWEGRGH